VIANVAKHALLGSRHGFRDGSQELPQAASPVKTIYRPVPHISQRSTLIRVHAERHTEVSS